MHSAFNHASVFTGIGGFDLAADDIGWNNVFQCEIDTFCQDVLKKNFPKTEKYLDINEFDARKYRGAIDVISGGFPCQDISISGKGEGITGSRSGLWKQYFRIIAEVLPGFVVIENSPQLLKKGFETVLYDLSEIGYNAEWEVISAAEFGKPHIRERLWVVAYPSVQRWRGILHLLKRSLVEKGSKANSLDTQSHPFLRFEQGYSEPPVFGVVDGLSKRLDVVKRLGACGNAVVPDIPKAIFQQIEYVARHCA